MLCGARIGGRTNKPSKLHRCWCESQLRFPLELSCIFQFNGRSSEFYGSVWLSSIYWSSSDVGTWDPKRCLAHRSNPNIQFFIDLHSYGEDILYSWGDATDQTADPNMNFRNPAYDGVRGDASYQEFITADDRSMTIALANSMADAIQAVPGRPYTVEQSISLYPTAGTSDDYSFSRHLIYGSKNKVVAYTLEWGSPSNPTPFIRHTARHLSIIDCMSMQ